LTFQSPMNFDQYSTSPNEAQSWQPHRHSKGKQYRMKPVITVPTSTPSVYPNRSQEELVAYIPSKRSVRRRQVGICMESKISPHPSRQPVKIPEHHPLWRNHNPRFDISGPRFAECKHSSTQASPKASSEVPSNSLLSQRSTSSSTSSSSAFLPKRQYSTMQQSTQ